MTRRTVVWCIIPACLSSCFPKGGDMIVRVSGSIPGTPSLPCTLHIKSEDSDRIQHVGVVDKDFATSLMVVVGPHPVSHHLIAICPDGATYRSKGISLSSKQRQAIYLGALYPVEPEKKDP